MKTENDTRVDGAPEQGRMSSVGSGDLVRPLFIPLKREYFEAFENGTKQTEYRLYGPRWNEQTCAIGRPVVLSLGYGKARRLRGEIVGFVRDDNPRKLPGWKECYGLIESRPAACIGIALWPNQ